MAHRANLRACKTHINCLTMSTPNSGSIVVTMPGARDYLLNNPWHTFPGRMSAWCATRQVSFRVSKSELPADLPAATRYLVRGFLVGNVPPPTRC